MARSLALLSFLLTGLGFGWPQFLYSSALQDSNPAAQVEVAVDLVPVDVIVLDEKGRPVSDLSRKDFRLKEDGDPQQITHFSLKTVDSPDSPLGSSLRSGVSSHRTFLIVLGRGAHQVFKPLRSLIQFVREGLDPEDRVAVMAYDRATAFTTDHELIAQFITEYQDISEHLETVIKVHSAGLASIYGIMEMPESFRKRIDALFDRIGTRSRTVLADQDPFDRKKPVSEQSERSLLSTAEWTHHNGITSAYERWTGGTAGADPASMGFLTDLPFDTYMEGRARTNQDIAKLFAAIEYLRFSPGEKHIIFFTEYGLFLPRLEDNRSLTSTASDARVRIHCFHTGHTGLDVPSRYSPNQGMGSGDWEMRFLRNAPGGQITQARGLEYLDGLAELTGGFSFIRTDIDKALRQTGDATRHSYLISYRPTNRDFDGSFRTIDVHVGRKGYRVLARRGYYAIPFTQEYDSDYARMYSRIVTAAEYPEVIEDVSFNGQISEPEERGNHRELLLNLSLRLDSFTTGPARDNRTRQMAWTTFGYTKDGRLAFQDWADLNLSPIHFRGNLSRPVPLIKRLSIQERIEADRIKVILYDYQSDRIGSQTFQLK
ncbi:MAG: VWA domain-containing protein [Acidobacteriota bacterium]|nr:MAG: VWA domain-containing protein [Acidobacteriota bacterium]